MQSLNYWILTIDSDFCSVGDLILTGHGWNFGRDCEVGTPRRGDNCLVFDSRDQKFKKVGVFLGGVDKKAHQNGQVRFDFDIRVSNKKTPPILLRCLRRRWKSATSLIQVPMPRPNKLSPITRQQFDTALSLWWGVSNFTDLLNDDLSLKGFPNDSI